jgi:PhnB protein
VVQINPYLNFDGNCEEAFNFYQKVFGGDVTINRFSEMPGDQPGPEADKVMHAELPLGDGQKLFGSDRLSFMGATTLGDNVQISISPVSSEEGSRLFAGLADGGEITQPYEKAFWGAEFGMCVDRFGVRWLVNYDEIGEDARRAGG